MQSCTASLMTKLLTEQREKRERAKQLPDEQVRNDISYTDIYSTLCIDPEALEPPGTSKM